MWANTSAARKARRSKPWSASLIPLSAAPSATAPGSARSLAKAARLSVFRSSKHISVQLIDDVKGVTVASASSLDEDFKVGTKSEPTPPSRQAHRRARAKKAGVKDVVFDRGGYIFHGRVKALADAAREGGLNSRSRRMAAHREGERSWSWWWRPRQPRWRRA
jgi:large subunit ribosomal protein L18